MKTATTLLAIALTAIFALASCNRFIDPIDDPGESLAELGYEAEVDFRDLGGDGTEPGYEGWLAGSAEAWDDGQGLHLYISSRRGGCDDGVWYNADKYIPAVEAYVYYSGEVFGAHYFSRLFWPDRAREGSDEAGIYYLGDWERTSGAILVEGYTPGDETVSGSMNLEMKDAFAPDQSPEQEVSPQKQLTVTFTDIPVLQQATRTAARRR